MGITSALVFCNLGAAYGTAKSGVGIASVGVLKSDLVFKSLIPIIMAGILGIYGLIVSVILQGKSKYIAWTLCGEVSVETSLYHRHPKLYFSQLNPNRLNH
jgi:ATP synthase proteolipid subunit